MVSRVQAFVDFTHGSSASTEYRCSVTGYVLVYGLFPYGYMIFGYVSAVAVTWLLLRPSLSGGGCLPLRSSAVLAVPVMATAAFRTGPFPDGEVPDIYILITAAAAGLAAREPSGDLQEPTPGTFQFILHFLKEPIPSNGSDCF